MKSGGFESLQKKLMAALAKKFPDISVDVEHSARWNRPCVTFRSSTFRDLLPEERFHRLVAALPADLREEKLAGFVWVELAEGESLEKFLKFPRSEDIARREAEIYKKLCQADLFGPLETSMGKSPDKRCRGDFREMVRVLTEKSWSPAQVRDAKLLMIRHRAFCDCQVLLTAQAELARLFVSAA